MNVRYLLSFLIYAAVMMTAISAFAQRTNRPAFAKGVYGDPSAFLKAGISFRSAGINALFVRSVSITDDLFDAARREDVRLYAEFPTLNGKEYLTDHPEAWPINERGQQAPAADWFMGVCLSDEGFKEFRREQLRTLLGRYAVDGVWLDYLHWHAQFETPDPILPETCFCDRCLGRFGKEARVNLPVGNTAEKAQWILTNADSLWRQWRSEVLTEWVRDMKTIVKEVRPQALLGIYYCPWYPDDYDGAHYRTLGLDMPALARVADVFSPMLYHHMMERTPEWVGEYVQWLKSSGLTSGDKPKVWPIVQAHNKPGVVTTEEFRQVMWNGSRPPASGIMMFTLHTLIGEPAKLEVMKDLYKKR